MPIYEYNCQNCGKEFEELVRGTETPACPICNSNNVERKLSLCACHSKGNYSAGYDYAPAAAPSGCSGCSGGHCSTCGR